MSALDTARKISATLAPWRWFIAAGIATVVIVFVVRGWNAERDDKESLRRELEEAKASQAGAVVSQQQKQAEVERLGREILSKDAALADALTRLEQSIGRVKVLEAWKLHTSNSHAGGEPVTRDVPNDTAAVSPPATPLCLVYAGDEGRIDINALRVLGKGGARSLLLDASAVRLGPPERVIWQGTASAPISVDTEVAQPSPVGWGGGLYVGAGRGGIVAGPAAALPPWKVWGLQLEAAVGIGVNATGDVQGGATAVVRP